MEETDFFSDNYSVDRIYGIRMGYRGFYDKQYQPYLELNPTTVEGIHQEGGLRYIWSPLRSFYFFLSLSLLYKAIFNKNKKI